MTLLIALLVLVGDGAAGRRGFEDSTPLLRLTGEALLPQRPASFGRSRTRGAWSEWQARGTVRMTMLPTT